MCIAESANCEQAHQQDGALIITQQAASESDAPAADESATRGVSPPGAPN